MIKPIFKIKENMAIGGLYIYGIVPNFYGGAHFRSLKNAGVYAIPFQNISAIVGDRENKSLDLSNRESVYQMLMHHQIVIDQIIALGFIMILPMKPGTSVIAKDEVLTILTKGHDLFISSFNHIENMMEIDLIVTWSDFGGVLKDLSSHPEIVEETDSNVKKNGIFSQTDHVKTGMLVWEKLIAKNKEIELKILNVLTSFSTNLKLHEVINDQMIINAAFLIKRNLKEKFKQRVVQFDQEFNGLLHFKLSRPLPCYSFFTIELKELNPEKIAFAKRELGLNEEPSELVIKKAYLEYIKQFHPDAQYNNGAEDRFKRIRMAYNTLIEYSMAVKQSSDIEFTSLVNDKITQKMFLVKMKE